MINHNLLNLYASLFIPPNHPELSNDDLVRLNKAFEKDMLDEEMIDDDNALKQAILQNPLLSMFKDGLINTIDDNYTVAHTITSIIYAAQLLINSNIEPTEAFKRALNGYDKVRKMKATNLNSSHPDSNGNGNGRTRHDSNSSVVTDSDYLDNSRNDQSPGAAEANQPRIIVINEELAKNIFIESLTMDEVNTVVSQQNPPTMDAFTAKVEKYYMETSRAIQREYINSLPKPAVESGVKTPLLFEHRRNNGAPFAKLFQEEIQQEQADQANDSMLTKLARGFWGCCFKV